MSNTWEHVGRSNDEDIKSLSAGGHCVAKNHQSRHLYSVFILCPPVIDPQKPRQHIKDHTEHRSNSSSAL